MGRDLPPVINDRSSGEITTRLTLSALAQALFTLDFLNRAFDQIALGVTLLGADSGGINHRYASRYGRENKANAPVSGERQGLQTILEKSFTNNQHRNRSQ